MAWYTPILLWLATVLLGSPLFAFLIDLGEPEGVLAVMAVAGVCGAPALVLFLIWNAVGRRLLKVDYVTRSQGMFAYAIIAALDILAVSGLSILMGDTEQLVLFASLVYGPIGALLWWFAWPKTARANPPDLSSLLDQT